MKVRHLVISALMLGLGSFASAQDVPVDYSKYPDYSPVLNPDRYGYGEGPQINIHSSKRVESTAKRPDHVDNSQKMFFPPVFNQSGGSCGSASRICYMFTWELNAYRNLNGKDPKNYYPSHFVWLLTNGNSGKDAFVQFVGVPSAATYGGQTTSSLFGWQVETDNNFGWMTGYEKWYEAMHNRMWAPSHIPYSVAGEEGREYLKNWIWNHCGDNDFQAGGVAGIGVASGGTWLNIPSTDKNKELGVVGKKYVSKWGTSVDHALTIVGYDDRIEFDLDGNGVAGEKDKDEVGAWIIVNSWGSGWCNQGFVYCPYKHAVTAFTGDGKPNGSYYAPEIYRVRKDYRPERTIKLKMDYNRRSEIALSAGISTNLNATKPDQTIPFHHFQYAGDGHNGNSNPAPEVPMLGKWADGKLHDEPMEFGYDLTDLTAGADRNLPIKYFFIINTKSWAQGEGHIYEAAIMDYNLDPDGIEIPFDGVSEDSPVEIVSKGKQTIISVVVQGDGYADPRNIALDEDGKLTWDAPARTGRIITSYNIYKDAAKVASAKGTEYKFDVLDGYVYGVTAVYSDGHETKPVTVNAPVMKADEQTVYEFTQSGFSIPNVFKNNYAECTIEFLIRPKTLKNWNQSAGPGWGTFYMHANEDGRYTAGWNTGDRVNTTATLKVGEWSHVAVVVKKKVVTIYINGTSSGSFTSNTYSGIGGFGNFTFTANSGNNANLDALIDEVRIWNHARTSTQITKNKYAEFSGQMLPDGLVAYYKGGTFAKDGSYYMIDVAGGNHAQVLNSNFKTTTTNTRNLTNPTETTKLTIDKPSGTYVAGQAMTLSATVSSNINRVLWSCEEAGFKDVASMSPSVTFPKAGTFTVKAVGYTYKDETVEATRDITIGETESVTADFSLAKDIVPAGQPVALMAANPVASHIYEWTLPGARVEKKGGSITAVTYDNKGNYTVTLTVSSPDGKTATCTKRIEVMQAAPKSGFRVSPNVIVKGEKTYLIDESKQGPTKWQWKVASNNQTYIVNGQNSSLTPTKAGVYDVTLTASNESGQSNSTQGSALYVCNADSKNGLSLIGYPNSQVTAQSPLSTSDKGFTIEFWLEAPTLSDCSLGIGDENGTMMLEAYEYGALVLWMNETKSVATNAKYILTNGWHHYAITYKTNGNVYFYRDGEKFTGTWFNQTSVPALSKFRIGGSDRSFNARIDELRVWNRDLSLDEIRAICTAPIEDVAAAEEKGLRLYYDFNQSGGSVEDRTSNHNNGVRTGFGPDGDAWGLSQGVFALSFDNTDNADVTKEYFKNYKKSFSYTSTKQVNTSAANRFYEIKNWTLENTIKSGSVTTGVHVDTQKNNCFTCTSGWDGFATEIVDHKAFQTFTLPAGVYTLTVSYDDKYEGQCGNSYIVASAGKTLNVTNDLGSAIAYKKMDAKTSAIGSNSLTFSLSEETEVSLGLLINQSGKLCMAIQEFKLEHGGAEILDANNEMPDAIEQVEAVKATVNGTYDLQGRRIASPNRSGLYIINGKKVVVK